MPYKRFLERNNIDLILIRYPSRADFAARVLGADEFQENPAWVEHYYECLKNDIEIVDPMSAMWEHRFEFPLFYFYNLPFEQHPYEGEWSVAAKVLSEVVKRYSIPLEDSPITLRETSISSSDPQFFWPAGNPKYKTDDNIVFDQAIQNDDSIKTLQTNSGHPILFLSNSFLGGFPFRDRGASVPAYLSFLLQTKPDWFFQAGIGNGIIRNLISYPELLTKRQAVIMIAAFNMWNSPFPSFPQYILDDARSISLEKTIDILSDDISILDNGSFLFTKQSDGTAQFVQNIEKEDPERNFRIEISIPPFDKKKTCMFRVNYGEVAYSVLMDVLDENGKRIDSAEIATGSRNVHVDFFIPVSDAPRKITLLFEPSSPNKPSSINNFELWYY